MIAEDYIDVHGAQSVIEVAEVVAAALGARMEMGGELDVLDNVERRTNQLLEELESLLGEPGTSPDRNRPKYALTAANKPSGPMTFTVVRASAPVLSVRTAEV